MGVEVSSTTPYPGIHFSVPSGGGSVLVIPSGIDGGFITNPSTATEVLYVDPTKPAQLQANGTTFALVPGQTWAVIPGQVNQTWVNAASDGHLFSAIFWQSLSAPPPQYLISESGLICYQIVERF